MYNFKTKAMYYKAVVCLLSNEGLKLRKGGEGIGLQSIMVPNVFMGSFKNNGDLYPEWIGTTMILNLQTQKFCLSKWDFTSIAFWHKIKNQQFDLIILRIYTLSYSSRFLKSGILRDKTIDRKISWCT